LVAAAVTILMVPTILAAMIAHPWFDGINGRSSMFRAAPCADE
jgi:hypothetical protein